jgi:hypothetical protein
LRWYGHLLPLILQRVTSLKVILVL